MEITGKQIIAAPRQRVWDALNDPEVLRKCLPGCESVERSAADELKVVMAAAIGPLRARFTGTLRMTDVQAPSVCTIVFEGQGGAVGFGKGSSSVTLQELNDTTELSYTAQAQVGGKLAQVGSRLIDSVARKMANDFFKAFSAQLTTGTPAGAAVVGETKSNRPANLPKQAEIATAMASAPDIGQGRTAPASDTTPRTDSVMVPGWWLGVATVLGSLATLAGVLIAR